MYKREENHSEKQVLMEFQMHLGHGEIKKSLPSLGLLPLLKNSSFHLRPRNSLNP